jgi:DNA-binding NarL/FixJ family response regulator
MEKKVIRVMAVDDHPLMMSGISGEINAQSDMRVVAEAADGDEALTLFRKHRPDVTLMDLKMPRMNGIEAISAIRQEAPRARIVVLTTAAGDVQMIRAFKAGVKKFLADGSDRYHPLGARRSQTYPAGDCAGNR